MGLNPSTSKNAVNLIAALADAGSNIYSGYAGASALDTRRVAALQAADYNRAVGRLRSEKVRRTGEKITGRQRLAIASQGGDPNSGSALAVLRDTAEEAELDALIEEHEGSMRAWMSTADAARYAVDAKTSIAKGMMGGIAPLLKSANYAGKLLTGIGRHDYRNTSRPKKNNWEISHTQGIPIQF